MDILISLIVGLIAGGLASAFVRGKGFGCVGNIIIGLIGGFVGGMIFRSAGLESTSVFGSILVSFVGAVVLLTIVKMVKSL